jgi:hypothetical protein
MMEWNLRFGQALRQELEEGLEQPLSVLPPYQTIQPRLLSSTHHVGALDGSDQQMFAAKANEELGIGVWARLYVEYDIQQPEREIYRDGPPSSGPWSENDLLFYQLTIQLPNRDKNRHFRNDYYSIKQILSSARAVEPPILMVGNGPRSQSVREEAAKERATGEWLALRSALIHQLAPHDLLLKDGRFNCQLEQAASWVDQTGRIAARNRVRVVAVVKSGSVYERVFHLVQAIAKQTDRPFYFPLPQELIEESYQNENYPTRKTLMVGGKDHTDLAGIGALWVAFCPDPHDFTTFVILEFNLYDLYFYRELAKTPITLREWHAGHLAAPTPHGRHIHVTDLKIHEERDFEDLVEPTISEILWLCEREIGRFGYPNLLGIAHHDVVLTRKKVELLRKRYLELLVESDAVIDELIGKEFVESPHKLHNIH